MEQPAIPQSPKITLYWLNDSRAQRMVWLLEELGVDYDVEIFRRNPDLFAPSELQKIHPLGKSPIVRLTTPDPADPTRQKDLVLAESGFIAQYLCEHFGRTQGGLLPTRYRDGQEGQLGGETDEWLRCQYFLHYAEGSLMPPLLVALILNILKSPRIPFVLRPITSGVADKIYAAFVVRQMATHLSFLETQLETAPGGDGNGKTYLCGARLTAADILMSYPLLEAKERVGSLSMGGKGQGKLADKYPKVWAYLDRLREEPGYKRAEARIEEEEMKRRRKKN
ncbi:hypothetical protein C8A03DRAFT_34299 [Achaetomium macrosporum]|uniref:Glutathione transferase n=1 Tax=Achaetomium macrosporum TaxID=79813 RepID=A0AAN7CAG4_9PEZI|nr:hypothetical protein C8A03DRAFT_34299 [Achaetomium macrosporum]